MTPRLVVALALVAPSLVAQQPVLSNLPGSVRAAGMAGSTIALTGDAAVVFVNPAIIGPIRRLAVEASYAHLPVGGWYGAATGALRSGGLSLGAGIRTLSRTANERSDELEWVAAVASHYHGVHFGVSTDYVSLEDSTGRVSRSLTQDAGVMVAFFDIAALALSFENLGRTPLGGARLSPPSRTRLGFSLNLIDTYSNGRLLATVETVWTGGGGRTTLLGVEGGVVVHGIGLVARIGRGAPLGGGNGRTSWGGSLVVQGGRARIDFAHQGVSGDGSGMNLFGIHWTP